MVEKIKDGVLMLDELVVLFRVRVESEWVVVSESGVGVCWYVCDKRWKVLRSGKSLHDYEALRDSLIYATLFPRSGR